MGNAENRPLSLAERIGGVLGELGFYKHHPEQALENISGVIFQYLPFGATRIQIEKALRPGEVLAKDAVEFEPEEIKQKAKELFPKSSGWTRAIFDHQGGKVVGFAYISGQLEDDASVPRNIRYL